MIFYLDTSLVVASLTTEAKSEDVLAWLGKQPTTALAVSGWVISEFSAALSRKVRMGQIDAAGRAIALSGFTRLYLDTAAVLPVSRSTFRLAANLADRYENGLRAGDALHLAICAEHGATLYTLDRRLAEAGLPLGVPTLLI